MYYRCFNIISRLRNVARVGVDPASDVDVYVYGDICVYLQQTQHRFIEEFEAQDYLCRYYVKSFDYHLTYLFIRYAFMYIFCGNGLYQEFFQAIYFRCTSKSCVP